MDDPVLEQHFVGHRGKITSLSFSPSGKQLLSSSDDHTFMNWNLNSSSGSLRYKAKSLPVTHVCFSPNGNLIASSQGQHVRIWESAIRGKSIEFRTHFTMVRSVQFSPEGTHLITASDDKSLKIWTTARRKFYSSLSGSGGHTNWVRFGTYSPDGHLIVSCSDDKTIKLWDPVTSKLVHTFNEVRGMPRYVKFHPSNLCIGVAMSTGTVKLYDLKMMKLLQYYSCHDGFVNSLSFHPSGTYLISAGSDQTSKVIDLIEGRAILSLEGHQNVVTAVEFSNSGENFATASSDKNVYVWRTNLTENKSKYKHKMKESLMNEDTEIPRVTTGSPKGKKPRITEVYCAKDYEEIEGKSENLINEDVNSCNSEEIRKTGQNEEPFEELTDSNAVPQTFSIDELMSQVAFLTNKLMTLETRLMQMEEMFKSDNG